MQINPIHGADLARFCVDRMEAGQEGQWDVGGPEVFTWEGLAQCAFQALDRPTKIKTISARLLPPLTKILGIFSRRRADTVRFVTWSMLHNCVGAPTGTHKLLEFYQAHAKDNV